MSFDKDFYVGLGVGVTIGLGVSLLSTYLYSSLIVDVLLTKLNPTKSENNNEKLDQARAILNGSAGSSENCETID